ncbi:ABC transporter ATP-binding protein [Halobacteriales archaeon Cl-PHB]
MTLVDPDTEINRTEEVVLTGENVTKEFSGLVALDDVSFDVRSNEILGLIGPNGAGKTTLFNCINGQFAPTNGTIRFNGDDITGMSPHEIARLGLGRTFQIVRPLEDLTVLENVMVGAHMRTRSRSSAKEIAHEKLEFVGLADQAAVQADELPMGSQKRMELARTLTIEPDLLLLDEILAGLPPAETDEMLDLFGRVRDGGTSLIVIEHDMESIMNLSDLVLVLNNGQRLAFDTPEAIVENDEVIEAYLGDQHA